MAEPLAVHLDTFNSTKHGKTDVELLSIIKTHFDLRPGVIVQKLGLTDAGLFERTACYGHFGWPEYPWEKPIVFK